MQFNIADERIDILDVEKTNMMIGHHFANGARPQASKAAFIDGAATARSKNPSDAWSFVSEYVHRTLTVPAAKLHPSDDRDHGRAVRGRHWTSCSVPRRPSAL
jgi:hypothetical protein